MSKTEPFKEFYNKFGMIKFHSINEFTSTVLMEVPKSKLKERAEKGFITRRQIENIKIKIKEKYGTDVLVSFSESADKAGMEAGLLAVLNANLKAKKIKSVSMSFFNANDINVIVFCKGLDSKEQVDVERLALQYLTSIKLVLKGVEYNDIVGVEPSLMVILRALKSTYPINLEHLTSYLIKQNYYIESIEWLSKKLDLLRKKDFLIRSLDGVYRLTHYGIEQVPVTRSRTSSDVERILTIAKRHL
ncbi:hypothetical protein AAGT46_002819 [Citrobacter werkmanii]|uniref:hypothetical protein n=1 Tax=Citrobacter freundii TaxID=546 RepID=UPI0022EA782C|nr:hypothetical protein [Citrobacter freundii]MDQ9166043.1 hypothetical protein [Citrobacter freundii]